MTENRGPLTGMKVIELAHVMAGPTCGRMLADMGADVIKVERVPDGDDTRRFLPPDIQGESAAYIMMNRNKRGIAIDLKSEDGKRILLRMIETADVIIENYRADTMSKLGLGYDDLKTNNPGLIYCAISGFGRTGPYANRGGYDLIAQGMSGLMSITGEAPGREPVKVGAPVTDITAGILGALGVCAAYAQKLKTGKGQMVDTSLYEAGITHTYWQSAIALATGISPGPMGSRHPLNTPYQSFKTADGWLNLGASNTRLWSRLLEITSLQKLEDDSRFKDGAARMANIDALISTLNKVLETKPTSHWLAEMERVGIPAGPVANIGEMHADPHTLAREMVLDVEHETAGTVKTIGHPIKFSETPGTIDRGAPIYGQHTRSILAEFGFNEEQITDMILKEAVIAAEIP